MSSGWPLLVQTLILAVLGDEYHLPPFTVKRSPACADSSWLQWVPVPSLLSRPSRSTCRCLQGPASPSPNAHLISPRASQGQKPWRHLVPELFFPPVCPSHYYCSVSPACISGSLPSIQPLTVCLSQKPQQTRASLTAGHPSHSSVSTSGPWKSPPRSPGPTAPVISKAWHLLPF